MEGTTTCSTQQCAAAQRQFISFCEQEDQGPTLHLYISFNLVGAPVLLFSANLRNLLFRFSDGVLVPIRISGLGLVVRGTNAVDVLRLIPMERRRRLLLRPKTLRLCTRDMILMVEAGWCAGKSEAAGRPEMTVESVHVALDEVRPYLIADGGDVTVAAVEADTGTVFLRLEVRCLAWALNPDSDALVVMIYTGFEPFSLTSHFWTFIRWDLKLSATAKF